MSIQIKKGVTLTCLPSKKFKTTRILFRFQTGSHYKTFASKALLSSLLETSTKKYQDRTQMSLALANLYGANFNTFVSRKGAHHHFNVCMSFANEKYLDENIVKGVFEFIREVLFAPNLENNRFPEEDFAREKQNLLQYILTSVEDKKYYASKELNTLFFKEDLSQSLPSYGRFELMEKVTQEEVFSSYQELLEDSVLDIFVTGDIEESEILEHVKQLPFPERTSELPSIFYLKSADNVIYEKTKKEKLSQSKLHIAYHQPVVFGDENYYVLQVMNAIFGGMATSKLFLNVREKESLAYYASSSFDSFRNLLTVQTGIDRENREKVMHLIHKQLEDICTGQITEIEMQQAKSMLINGLVASQDNQGTLIERAYIVEKFPNISQEIESVMQQIQAVTIKEVSTLAKQLKLSAVFFLEGGE